MKCLHNLIQCFNLIPRKLTCYRFSAWSSIVLRWSLWEVTRSWELQSNQRINSLMGPQFNGFQGRGFVEKASSDCSLAFRGGAASLYHVFSARIFFLKKPFNGSGVIAPGDPGVKPAKLWTKMILSRGAWLHNVSPQLLRRKAGGTGAQGHPQLHSRFEASLGYMKSCLKNKTSGKEPFLLFSCFLGCFVRAVGCWPAKSRSYYWVMAHSF